MREIKFRAWDKRTRKMVTTGFHVIGQVSAFDMLYDYGMKHGKRKNEVGLMRMNSFVIMQFTGVHDKNGNDIYESDILEFDPKQWGITKINPKGNIFTVKWDSDDGCWSGKGTSYDWTIHCTLIGNIYENPELLEKT